MYILAILVASVFAVLEVAAFDGQLGIDPPPPLQPEFPIVGILSQPNVHPWLPHCTQDIHQTYVLWLQQAGIRAVSIEYDLPREKLTSLLDNLNGAILTGGMQNMSVDSPFYKTAEFIADYALNVNANNDRFVLWGTCQGFQAVLMAAARNHSVMACDYSGVMGVMMQLEDHNKQLKHSRMISELAEPNYPMIYDDATVHNSTLNLHNCGVSPRYFSDPRFASTPLHNFSLLSTNEDILGQQFASTFEHREYDIYGTQWHPEGGQYWLLDLPQGPATLRLSNFLAVFLGTRLRMTTRTFKSFDDVRDLLLPTNYPLIGNSRRQNVGWYCVKPNHSSVDRDDGVMPIASVVLVVCLLAAMLTAIVWSQRRWRRLGTVEDMECDNQLVITRDHMEWKGSGAGYTNLKLSA